MKDILKQYRPHPLAIFILGLSCLTAMLTYLVYIHFTMSVQVYYILLTLLGIVTVVTVIIDIWRNVDSRRLMREVQAIRHMHEVNHLRKG